MRTVALVALLATYPAIAAPQQISQSRAQQLAAAFRSDGRIQADGHDSDRPSRTFVLENGRIEGAVLTAIKVYRDGATQRFEGVFMTRTERTSPMDPGITTSGPGVVLATPREFGGNTYDKLFYQLKQ